MYYQPAPKMAAILDFCPQRVERTGENWGKHVFIL